MLEHLMRALTGGALACNSSTCRTNSRSRRQPLGGVGQAAEGAPGRGGWGVFNQEVGVQFVKMTGV